MKILVTGGAGFIASHITDAYIKSGHQVVVLDNLSSGRKEFVNRKAKFYEEDIRDKKTIERIFKIEKPEAVNHHAAQISVRNSVSDPLFDAEVNLIGLLNLLEAGRKNNLKQVIFASSGGVVYGEAKIIPTRENYAPLEPISPYGISKLTSEHYLRFYYRTYGIQYTALRYSNVYGPRQNPHGEAGVVAIFSRKLLKGETPVINGNGKQGRDYIFIGDVVSANLLALVSKTVGSFNIGTAKETDVIKLYQYLKKITAKNIKAKYGPTKPGEQKRSCLNIESAQKMLDWQPKVTLSEGLARTVDYFKKYDK